MDSKLKNSVRKHYGKIASKVIKGHKAGCCSCADISSNLYSTDSVKGLPKEAVIASLGCAAPLLFADLQVGEVVLDLGSGGGIDVLQAAQLVGEQGKVYGLDMTDQMLELANKNKEASGLNNIEFIKGCLEDIPLADNSIDVIISNCVINLTEDKSIALAEAYRVLKDNGRIAIADMVALKDVDDSIKKDVELWLGCIAGTIKTDTYKEILKEIGFKGIEIKPINIYTKEHIRSMSNTVMKEEDFAQLDAAFASASVIAYK